MTTGQDELGELSELASTLALGAGELLASYSGKRAALELMRSEALTKSSSTDLATEADLASERFLVQAIAAERPDDAILGEEGTAIPGTSGWCWVIDPLDGTTNFVYGYSSYAVSLAVEYEGSAMVAAVYDPSRKELFAAIRGCGATLNGEMLSVAGTVTSLGQSLVGTGFGYESELRSEQAGLLRKLLPAVRDIRRGGAAALDLCYVAAGRLDLYYEAGLKAWDKAAGLLLCSEVGLQHCELAKLVAGAPTLVVGPPGLFSEFLQLLGAAASQ